MPSFCIASFCEQKYCKSDKTSFHKFPVKNSKYLKKWIEFVDRGSEWKPSRWSAICSQHFLASDFRINNLRRTLRKGAIPTLLGKPPKEWNKINKNEQHTTPKIYSFNKSNLETNIIDSFLESTCRLCSKKILDRSLLLDVTPLLEEIKMILTYIQRQQTESMSSLFPKHICNDCKVAIDYIKEFFYKVQTAQDELIKYLTAFENNVLGPDSEVIVPDEQRNTIKIKQEPFVIIKEEKLEPIKNASNILNSSFNATQQILAEDPKQSLPLNKFNGEIIEVLQLNNGNSNGNVINLRQSNAANNDSNNDKDDDIEILDTPPLQLALKVENVTEIDDDPVPTYDGDEEHINQAIEMNIVEEHSYAQLSNKVESKTFYPNKEDDEENEIPFLEIEMKDHVCKNCREVFDTLANLKIHEETMHTFKYKLCTVCNEEFKTTHEFITHKYKMHRKKCKNYSNRKGSTRKIFTCAECNEVCTSKVSLNFHKRYICNLDRYAPPEELPISPKTTTTVAVKEEVIDLDKLEDECAKENEPLFEPTAINSNWVNCLILPTNNFISEPTVNPSNHHVEFINFRKPFIFESSEKKGTPTFDCQICGKCFQTQSSINQHKITHTNIRKFKCNMCHKVFKRNAGLNQHINSFHFKIKPHTCEVCKHNFALKTDMLRCRHSKLKTF